MKIIQPRPFTFKSGPRAVLLLHAYTGHTADVRMLGRFLQTKNYTTHAPIYQGHGVEPEELLKVGPEDWWEDVLGAYQHLRDLGHKEIAVAGLSLGGVLALKLAYLERVKGIISMCSPMFFDNEERLKKAFKAFSREYKQLERKEKDVIEIELNKLMDDAPSAINKLGPLIEEVRDTLPKIENVAMVVQARKDQLINTESASYIYDHINSDDKELKWYEESGHVITLDKEKDVLHEDIYQFLESLDWTE